MENREETSQAAVSSGNQAPEIRRAPDFMTVYATSARVAYSEYDVRIFLGDVVIPNPSEKAEKEVVQERVCIILPAECAVSLERDLEQVTMAFENDYGWRRPGE